MNLIILRHGESEADILNIHEGRADFPLTDTGLQQVKLLSEWIVENEEIDIVLTSPLQRARSTAEAVAEKLGKELVICEDLMEWDNGLLAGLSREDAMRLYPLPPGGKKPHHKIAEAESMIEFRGRAERFMSILKEEYSGVDNVCIVSHGGMINMLYRALMGFSVVTSNSISCGDTAVNKFVMSEDSCHIIYINKQDHLIGFE